MLLKSISGIIQQVSLSRLLQSSPSGSKIRTSDVDYELLCCRDFSRRGLGYTGVYLLGQNLTWRNCCQGNFFSSLSFHEADFTLFWITLHKFFFKDNYNIYRHVIQMPIIERKMWFYLLPSSSCWIHPHQLSWEEFWSI